MAAVYEWISYAVKNRATDIHLETRGSTGVVRFRVDGEMEHMRADHQGTYPAQFIVDCMASMFNNEQMAKSGSDTAFDRDEFLYCMVPYNEIPGHTLKLRYQSLKGNEGPKLVLRILHVDENQPTQTFEELGYAPSQVEMWEEAMDTPSGLIAIAGVTSSGKSTTMKCFIELNPHTPHSNILTIEDPVEYPIRGAHQVPVQRDLANPGESAKRFTEALASFMRSDPDGVMMGEIRDRFSANAAQQLAETGHMALGTVHAHLLSGIVPRMVNPEIGMTRQILTAPNMVTLLAYQALVAKLCPKCAMTTDEASYDSRVGKIAENVEKLGLQSSRLRWKRIGGCDHCNGRGTFGQTVVAEMLMPDEEWLRQVREGNDGEAVAVYRSRSDRNLMSPNMNGKTVFEHTLYKALHGLVDARQCSAFDTWHRFMRHHERQSGL
jgi:type II secretory ATPase GspE/PulE/Tfp pilus assembly ATPase PilB-like protein